MSDLTPQPPSGYTLQRVMSAYQQLAARFADDPDLASDENVLTQALTVQQNAQWVLDSLIRAAVWTDRRVVEAETERKFWVSRKARYEARLTAIRNTIVEVLIATGVKRHRAAERLATLTEQTVPALHIDPDALPDRYVDIETIIKRKPKTGLILGDVAQGVVIEGVTVGNNPPVLRLAR